MPSTTTAGPRAAGSRLSSPQLLAFFDVKVANRLEAETRDPSSLLGAAVHYEIFFPDDADAEIKLLSISPAVVEVFGYELAAWERPADQWLQMLHPGDYARAVAASWAASRLGKPHSIEYRVTRADGVTLWILDEATIERKDADEVWRGTFTVIEQPSTSGWTPATLGPRIVSHLGPERARDLLNALEHLKAERAALISGLAGRQDTGWLADLLTDLEMDEPARLRVASGLRLALGG